VPETSRPWIARYPSGIRPERQMDYESVLGAWKNRVALNPDAIALRYFDGSLSAREVERASDALAVALAARGTQRGDRVGIYLQNIPQYVLSLLALWKLGATALLLNPMYRRNELRHLIDDSEATGVICTDSATPEILETTLGSAVRWIVSTSMLDYQSKNDPRVFQNSDRSSTAPDGDLVRLIEEYDGQVPSPLDVRGDEIALLTYTSGTTGPPKGAMNTHANVLNVATTFGEWVGVSTGDVVFALAPLFHITGAVINAAVALIRDASLVFIGRFQPSLVLETFEREKVTFTICSITVFNALLEEPGGSPESFASVKSIYSGGAPIPPATVVRFEDRYGVYIHNVYGMTETSSGVIAVPLGAEAPIHGPSGTLSVGVPLPNLTARIVDPARVPVTQGEQGELELAGPQVIPGYWKSPEATDRTFHEGWLRTGDVAIMDDAGWIYLVDRLKDQINVSGFKVWPREVEDVLYQHPSVLEAAVVGRPDDYRGETVVAFVSLKSGTAASEEELIAYAKERLAAYKYPRSIYLMDDLPKTLTGKIRRRELREELAGPRSSPTS
jgi:long-chain acyl-CoA synthetase